MWNSQGRSFPEVPGNAALLAIGEVSGAAPRRDQFAYCLLRLLLVNFSASAYLTNRKQRRVSQELLETSVPGAFRAFALFRLPLQSDGFAINVSPMALPRRQRRLHRLTGYSREESSQNTARTQRWTEPPARWILPTKRRKESGTSSFAFQPNPATSHGPTLRFVRHRCRRCALVAFRDITEIAAPLTLRESENASVPLSKISRWDRCQQPDGEFFMAIRRS